jgi:hypothetical protein
VCIGFASRAHSSDLPWAAVGGGHDQRADWGILGAPDNSSLQLQLVAKAHQIADGGSDIVTSFWRQKVEQHHHLRGSRQSLIESTTKAPSPSKFNFQPTMRTPMPPIHDVLSLEVPQLLQVRLSFHLTCLVNHPCLLDFFVFMTINASLVSRFS